MVTPVWCFREMHGGGEDNGHVFLQASPEVAFREAQAHAGRIRMICLDPPQGNRERVFPHKAGLEDWLDGKQSICLRESVPVYSSVERYTAHMRKLFAYSYELLSPDGSLYLHCSQRFSANARILLDEIFGRSNFVNEIIWHYEVSGRSSTHFLRAHDTIFLYQKGKSSLFHPETIGKPRGRERTNHMRRLVDPEGRQYQAVDVNGREYRYYEDDILTPDDIWIDIPQLSGKPRLHANLDGQRPEALLERMMLVSTLPEDLVFAPFAVAGSILLAAESIQRKCLCASDSFLSTLAARRNLIAAGVKKTLLCVDGQQQQPPELECQAHLDSERVILDYFHLQGKEPLNPMLDDGYYGLDLWGAGRRNGQTIRVDEVSMRGPDRPNLSGALNIKPGEGIPCLMVADAWGRVSYFDVQ